MKNSPSPSMELVERLRGQLRGELLRPADPGYQDACRLWNGMIERRPGAIVRCRGAADVMAVVNAAREDDLPLAVRGGGHNVAGSALCDGGIVADLSEMRAVEVDRKRRRVRAQGGAKLGDIDHETRAFGLAVPMGVVSRTGIGGLSLHGGMGFLLRKHGLTSDQLTAAEVVTADGNLISVDEREHPDLLWALRGGGGSFGVVTSFEFQAHPIEPQVWMAIVFYPVDRARAVLEHFRKTMPEAPDELMALAIFWSAPHEEVIPKELQGTDIVAVVACWSGPMDAGERAIRPFRELGTPIADLSGPMPFVAAQKVFDPEYPDGRRYYWKSTYLDGIPDDAIEFLIDQSAKRPSPISSVDVWALGGAFGRANPDGGAFFQRKAPFLLGVEANWDDPKADAANVAWVRGLCDGAQKHSPGGMYYNFPGFMEEGDSLLERSYGPHYGRLRSIKAKYDPGNLFRHGIGIRAAT